VEIKKFMTAFIVFVAVAVIMSGIIQLISVSAGAARSYNISSIPRVMLTEIISLAIALYLALRAYGVKKIDTTKFLMSFGFYFIVLSSILILALLEFDTLSTTNPILLIIEILINMLLFYTALRMYGADSKKRR
jgi:hypothetical protein